MHSSFATRQRKPYDQGYYDGYRGRDINAPAHPDDAHDYRAGYSDGVGARHRDESKPRLL